MKKLFIFLLAAILFGACQREYLPAPIIDNGHQITMKTSKAGTNTNSDTTLVERGINIQFSAISNGPNIKNWQWIFDSTEIMTGKNVSHIFEEQPPKIVDVQLIGTADNGQKYKTVHYFKVVWSADGLPAVVAISSEPATESTYNVVLAFNKAGMRYSGHQYFYIGDMTNWKTIDIPSVDTNYLVVKGKLLPDTNNVGKYIAVRMNLNPGKYKMGVGKIVNGSAIWGQFYDSTMVHLTLVDNGSVLLASDTANSGVPGTMGDKGPKAILRFNIVDTILLIYTNNGKIFQEISPFVAIQNQDGTRKEVIKENSIPGYPRWGQIKIKMSSLYNNILIMRYGLDNSNTHKYCPQMPKSLFWDPYYKVLKTMFIQMKSSKSKWSACPVR